LSTKLKYHIYVELSNGQSFPLKVKGKPAVLSSDLTYLCRRFKNRMDYDMGKNLFGDLEFTNYMHSENPRLVVEVITELINK